MWPFKIPNMWHKFESFSTLTAEIYPEFYHLSDTPPVYKLLLLILIITIILSKRPGLWIHNRFIAELRKLFKMSIIGGSQNLCILFSLLPEPFSLFCPVSYFADYLFKRRVSGEMSIIFWLATILSEYYVLQCDNNRCRDMNLKTYRLHAYDWYTLHFYKLSLKR